MLSAMTILEQYVTTDGLLRFIVVSDEGDLSIGFDGFGWHTHADILASTSGLPEDVAVRQFVDALLKNQSILAFGCASRLNGRGSSFNKLPR